jgi:transposase InsO family protein
VGSKGDSYDNAAAESANSLYKKELIELDGPWGGVRDATFATMEWVGWYNSERLHSACGYISPKELLAVLSAVCHPGCPAASAVSLPRRRSAAVGGGRSA